MDILDHLVAITKYKFLRQVFYIYYIVNTSLGLNTVKLAIKTFI